MCLQTGGGGGGKTEEEGKRGKKWPHSPNQSEAPSAAGPVTREHVLLVTPTRSVADRPRAPLIVTLVNLWSRDSDNTTCDSHVTKHLP